MSVNAASRRVCDWCSAYVATWVPKFLWFRDFGPSDFVDGVWTRVGPVYGWTEPKDLCRNCAESAHAWRNYHKGVFAEADA